MSRGSANRSGRVRIRALFSESANLLERALRRFTRARGGSERTNRSHLRAVFLVSILLGTPVAAGMLSDLRGWSFAGADRAAFTVARDTNVKHGGTASAKLSALFEPKAFGSLMQSVEATNYLNKRIRFRAWTKTAGVTGFAGLFVRIEGQRSDQTLAFDNMQDRPIKGDTDWAQRFVVLDVPASAKQIHFGVMLSGEGTVWLDDGELTEVSKDVPTTGVRPDDMPKNLDFEK